MEQWEYLTRFVEARATKKEVKTFIKENFDKKARRHSPESMIPELNQLGAEGWEIIHMEPVPRVGGKEDVQFDQYSWSNTYFIVAKRRTGGATPVVAVQRAQASNEQQNVPPPAPSPKPADS
jgi:hypothetical protein